MLIQPVPAKSRTEQTFTALREALIAGEFLPGARLRIDQLGKQFDASIGAIREALSRLTAEGLVVAVPQKGFMVAPVSRKDLSDLTEVRVDMENRCLIASIRHGTLEWEGRVIALQHQLRALGPKPRRPTIGLLAGMAPGTRSVSRRPDRCVPEPVVAAAAAPAFHAVRTLPPLLGALRNGRAGRHQRA